jgi:predicted ATPase
MKDKNKRLRVVLAGGPCCGKSTTINELKQRGYNTLEETARIVIEEGIFHPSRGAGEFQEEILRRQILKEEQIKETTFLDRSALEGMAYSLLIMNKIPKAFFNYNFHNKYDLVFLLDRFPLKTDGVRVESSDEEAQKIHNMISQTYLLYGYNPIRVPIMPIRERADYILEKIK